MHTGQGLALQQGAACAELRANVCWSPGMAACPGARAFLSVEDAAQPGWGGRGAAQNLYSYTQCKPHEPSPQHALAGHGVRPHCASPRLLLGADSV